MIYSCENVGGRPSYLSSNFMGSLERPREHLVKRRHRPITFNLTVFCNCLKEKFK